MSQQSTKTVAIPGFIVHEQFDWQSADEARIYFSCPYDGEFNPSDTTVCIQPHVLHVEIPENFDPTMGKIAALLEQQRRLQAQTQLELSKIQDKITKLQALTYTQGA